MTPVCQKIYVMNSSRYERSICRGLSNVVCDTKKFWTMAPQPTHKRLGVGASLTEFRQPLQVQSHLEMPGILVQLGHIQCF